MLTDELADTLHRHAESVSVHGLVALDRLQAERSRRRRLRAAVGSVVLAVLAVTAVTGWVARSTHRPDEANQIAPLASPLSGAGKSQIRVRCDTPGGAVSHYLDWPCLTSVDAGGSQLVSWLIGDGQTGLTVHRTSPSVGSSDSGTANERVRMRLLAYGPLTGTLAGQGSFAAAEFWSPRYPWTDLETYVSAGQGLSGGLGGPVRTARILYNTGNVQPDRGVSDAVCADTSPSHETAPPRCTDIFLTRSGITALRLLRPGLPPLTVPARHGFAELPATSVDYTHHSAWQVQALDHHHNVLATIPYAAVP